MKVLTTEHSWMFEGNHDTLRWQLLTPCAHDGARGTGLPSGCVDIFTKESLQPQNFLRKAWNTRVHTQRHSLTTERGVCVCYPSPHEYITVKFYHRLWIPSKISTSIRITHLTYKANTLETRSYSFLKIEEGNPHKYGSWWRGPNLIVKVIQSLSPIPSRNHGKQYATWLWVRIIWWTSLKDLATFTQTMQQISDKTVQQLN